MSFCVLMMAALFNISVPDDQAEEFKNLNGKWKIEQAEINGAQLPDSVRQEFSMIMKDGTYEVHSKSPTDEGTVRVDGKKNPKTMEIKGMKGPNQGRTILAIYELDKDTLKICYDLSGKKYPTEFSAPANSGRMLATCKRSKE